MGDNLDALLIIAGIGAGLYLLNKTTKAFESQPQTQLQTQKMVQSAGGKTYTTSLGTFWAVPGGSVPIDDNWKPNLAQKLLVGLDNFIPGDWLTRKVFAV